MDKHVKSLFKPTMLLCVGFLFGCKMELPVSELPSQLILETYRLSGELAESTTIGASDPVYQRTKELLEKERTGWEKSYVSYKTGPYILRSQALIIRCYPDFMVVDSFDKNGSVSLRKNIPNLLQALGLSIAEQLGSDPSFR